MKLISGSQKNSWGQVLRRGIATALLAPAFLQSSAQREKAPSASPTAAELQQAAAPSPDTTWWKHAVVYEVYPRSFKDSNGDGVGDLNGIASKLGYLQHLGVDAIWIAPMYPSPQADFGYDISDYEKIDPQYGSLKDFDRLMADARRHNIRIVLDMVLNHTSAQHPWFLESSSSRTNPRADWYVWNDGVSPNAPGVTDFQRRYVHQGPKGPVVPPTNWEAQWGGSSWEWNETRKQFYYHKFHKLQPDLNWSNPAVEKAMFAQMKFWLDRGVAGFRLDAIGALFEDPQMRNEPETGGTDVHGDPNLRKMYSGGFPQVHDVLRRLRAMTDSYPGKRVLIGEVYSGTADALNEWFGTPEHPELQLPMDTQLGFGGRRGQPFDAARGRQVIRDAATDLHGNQPLFVLDNHDNMRSWDRLGDGEHNDAIARVGATLLYTTHSTALTYYGAELGMHTWIPTSKSQLVDPRGISGWPKDKGRDGARTPMQWNSTAEAGFTTGTHTWLPVQADYKTLNAADESKDPHSMLSWTTALIALRRSVPALHDGGTVMLDNSNASVLSYIRTAPAGVAPVLVSVNMTDHAQTVHLDLAQAGVHGSALHVLQADDNSLRTQTSAKEIHLPPFTSLIAEVR